jgi:serine/threonine protein phosphatase PrpC
MARRYKWGNVLVVSDGLGSKPHSDHGAKAACLAVIEAAKIYQKNKLAKIDNILRLIHAHWLVNVAPFSPEDCSATCLFAIGIDESITLGRLGDGMIALCSESENDCIVLTDSKQGSFSNYTFALYQEFKPDQWETTTVESSKYNAVVLCTDGISDDILPERQVLFAYELHRSYVEMSPRRRKIDVIRWLEDWPVPGHSDDKTIACLFKEASDEAICR